MWPSVRLFYINKYYGTITGAVDTLKYVLVIQLFHNDTNIACSKTLTVFSTDL